MCDKPFTKVTAGNPPKVCSVQCRNKKSTLLQKAKRDAERRPVQCTECGTEFLSRTLKLYTCSKTCSVARGSRLSGESWQKSKQSRPHFKEIECSYCSRPVTVPSSFTQKIVSHPECKAERKKARNRIKQTRRRGYRATLRNLSVEKMGDRDNWTCHICREPVNPLLPSNHREGASVDHVIPLSRGGSDEPENLKLSHWICNVRKSNKVNYAQSR